jgi:hypothetical protein
MIPSLKTLHHLPLEALRHSHFPLLDQTKWLRQPSIGSENMWNDSSFVYKWQIIITICYYKERSQEKTLSK